MDVSYTIQISTNLVNKLARDSAAPKKKAKKPTPKTPEPPHKHQTKFDPPSAAPKNTNAWPVQTPMFLPVPPPPPPPAPIALAELEAIQSVLKESESLLKKLEQQDTNMTQGLTQRAKELREKEFKPPSQKSVPCEVEKEACKECYYENLNQPLKCAEVVRSFDECARRARRQQQHQQ